MLLSFLKEKIFILVFVVSLFIGLGLAKSCWNMNFWPSDAEVYYMPAAKDLFHHQYLSQMHQGLDEERIKWLHGKEMHVLAIAILQQWMHDTQTLRPLVLLGCFAVFFSSLLIYLIIRKLWGKVSSVVVWFLFTTSFWPYLYVLFTKHQTQGLMLFLFAIMCMVYATGSFLYLMAGICMGMSIFSSTVSMLYMPLVAAAFLLEPKKIARNIILFAIGFSLVVFYVNWPNVLDNLRSYAQYVSISGKMNHFFYNQKVLVQWLPRYDLKDTRGGLMWVVKYLWLVIPYIIIVFWVCVYRLFGGGGKQILLWLCLSFSAVIMAECKGVAQYGANYFPAMIGLLMFIGFSLRDARFEKWWFVAGAIVLSWNVYVFATDIYPSRMVTTKVADFLERKKIDHIYTFRQHVLRPNILDHLNPEMLKHLSVAPIESVVQVDQGYILLPPISTDSIYRASNGDYNDFDGDPVLNNIVRQGRIKDYAVAGFRTLGSSLIWSQEEEIFAYRYLVRGQFQDTDLNKVWILDGSKISRDRPILLPSEEDISLLQNNVRNIGTETRQLMYTGYQSGTAVNTTLKGLAVRIYKVGDPKDNLKAFIFRLDDKQPMWVPYAPGFISKPLFASAIGPNKEAQPVIFIFEPPIDLKAGSFFVVIYRDGKPSDIDFYRIYAGMMGRVE